MTLSKCSCGGKLINISAGHVGCQRCCRILTPQPRPRYVPERIVPMPMPRSIPEPRKKTYVLCPPPLLHEWTSSPKSFTMGGVSYFAYECQNCDKVATVTTEHDYGQRAPQ